MSQNGPKTTSLMTSVTKNPQPPTKKFFFKCRLEDWPIRLKVWTAQSAEELGRQWGNWQLLFFGQFQITCISYPSSQSVKTHMSHVLPSLCNFTTCLVIELENCWKPLKAVSLLVCIRSVDCGRELFKPPKDPASLSFFVDDVTSGESLGLFGRDY